MHAWERLSQTAPQGTGRVATHVVYTRSQTRNYRGQATYTRDLQAARHDSYALIPVVLHVHGM